MNGWTAAAAIACGLLLSGTGAAQEPGALVPGPPEDIFMEITAGPGGEPVLSEDEFLLQLGGYYRFNFVCPAGEGDFTGFHLEVDDLLANAHLRVVSVGGMEMYMQGLSFRAIECDEPGSARFSFHPMRRGVYQIHVRDSLDPPQEAFGRFVVE